MKGPGPPHGGGTDARGKMASPYMEGRPRPPGRWDGPSDGFDGKMEVTWDWSKDASASSYSLAPDGMAIKCTSSPTVGPGKSGIIFFGDAAKGYAAWSVVLRARMDAVPENGILWSTGDNGDQVAEKRLFLRRGAGDNRNRLEVIKGTGEVLLTSSPLEGLAAFRSFALVSDETNLRLYVDSEQVGASEAPHTTPKTNLQISKGVNNSTDEAGSVLGQGLLVDAFLGYAATLSEDEVKALAEDYAAKVAVFGFRAPLLEETAVYDDFEGAFGYGWTWSKADNWLPMPATAWSRQGLLTTKDSKPGKEYLPFVGSAAGATASAWTVSVYGILSCRDDAGIWSFGKPGATSDTAFHLGLVRRAGNVLQVVRGNPGGTEEAPAEPTVLCEATVEGLDTDSRLYSVASDGTAVRLLVDGAEVAAATPDDAETLKVCASWQVGIFAGSHPSYEGLVPADGMALDAVALQGRALTDGELAALAEHVFPRVPGVNVAVPEIELPAAWGVEPPTVARNSAFAPNATAYSRLKRHDATDDWRVAALTDAEGGNVGGPGVKADGEPSALFALGGTVNNLVGAVHDAKTRTYVGDTFLVVSGTQASVIAGGANALGAKWESPTTMTFKGSSIVVVREILPTGRVHGGSCSTSSSDGGAIVHEGPSAVRVEIPEELSGMFGAMVLGGSWDSRQTNGKSKASGDASVTIDAPNVTFSGVIAAGNGENMEQGTGTATLVLKAGIFKGTLNPSGGATGTAFPSTLAIEGDIDLSEATLGAFDTLTLAGKLNLGTKRLTATTLAEPTEAAGLTFSATEGEIAAGAPIVLCKTAFDALPDGLAVAPTEPTEGWEARVTPDRLLVYAPKHGEHVWGGGDTSWGEAFPDWQAGDTATFEAPIEGSRTVTLGGDISAERVAFAGANRLQGPGVLSVTGVELADGASLALPGGEGSAFSHLRLTLGKSQSGTTTDLALAELILTKGGAPVAWPRGTVIARGNGSTPAWNNNEQINALIDGVYASSKLPAINPEDGSEMTYATADNQGNNKWFVGNASEKGNLVAVIALGAPVEADGYTLWTGDSPGRTPAEWTLEVSDDGTEWRPFDARSGLSGFAKHTAYRYPTRLDAEVLTLGEGVTLDLSEGASPIAAGTVRGAGATVALPEGGISGRVPFLVTPTRGLTFTVKGDEEAWFRVVYADGAYCVEPNTLTQPFSATVSTAADWTALPWVDAEGFSVPARVWADAAFAPDVTLTFAAAAKVTFDTRAVGALTVLGEDVVGRLEGGSGAVLTVGTLDVRRKLFVGAVKPTGRVLVAEGANLTADIGSAVGDWVWDCAVEGAGTFVKRGSNKLTFNGKVSVAEIVHGWNAKSTLVFAQDYSGAILFSRETANAHNLLDSAANGGGKVELAEGVTLTLTECDVGGSTSGRDGVFAGMGSLVLPEGAALSLADGYCLDASGLASVAVAGTVAVTVADPAEGRMLVKCKAPTVEEAARLAVAGDWRAVAQEGTGYALAPLPTPAEGHGLEGETLRAVRLAAAKAGLTNDFTVSALSAGKPASAAVADLLRCFEGLPLEADAGANALIVTCDFGIAALRLLKDEERPILIKAQVVGGDYAEGTAVQVLRGGVLVEDAEAIDPPEGEVSEVGVRWFRIPTAEGSEFFTVRAVRE